MFAVKGWSVSADELKSEVSKDSAKPETQTPKSKKRKRSGAASQAVTASNVADLWTKVIDGKETPRQAGQTKHKNEQQKPKDDVGSNTKEPRDDPDSNPRSEKKRQKKKQKKQYEIDGDAQVATTGAGGVEEEEWGGLDDAPVKSEATPQPVDVEKTTDQAKLQGTAKSGQDKLSGPQSDGKHKKNLKKVDEGQGSGKTRPDQTQAGAPDKPAVKLTPLQASMRKKLVSARFRHLNETLYTKPSTESFALFKDSPDMFAQYHEGFRRQVEVWPENPVDTYIAEIKTRAKIRFFGRQSVQPGARAPLPRSDGTCTIADLGCGDAAIAAAIQSLARKLHVEVKSFDLQSPSPLVTRADIANLPLANGTVDVAVFCLALMGTNWVDFIEEAYRVLRWKGELWVAEIKSRFTMPGAKKQKVVDHSVGNRRKSADAKKGGKAKGAEHAADAADEADLVVEVDGADDQRRETDVSAFVDVLKKRGFVLRGNPAEAIDMSNKMFVKMAFVKAAPALKGKCASQGGDPRLSGKVQKKFLGDDEDENVEKEASVLKPCVYKIR